MRVPNLLLAVSDNLSWDRGGAVIDIYMTRFDRPIMRGERPTNMPSCARLCATVAARRTAATQGSYALSQDVEHRMNTKKITKESAKTRAVAWEAGRALDSKDSTHKWVLCLLLFFCNFCFASAHPLRCG